MKLFKVKREQEGDKKSSLAVNEKESHYFFCNSCTDQKEGAIVKPEMIIKYEDFQQGR
jgi:hypothetical protein